MGGSCQVSHSSFPPNKKKKYPTRSIVASPSGVGRKIPIPFTSEIHHFFSRQGLCLNAFRSRTGNLLWITRLEFIGNCIRVISSGVNPNQTYERILPTAEFPLIDTRCRATPNRRRHSRLVMVQQVSKDLSCLTHGINVPPLGLETARCT